jgi:class 3 adenylate cyclase/TolB-like protein/tetratricopeptide (TPR) repeat protein
MNAAQRRLVALLVADVAGYTGLMEADEDGTYARMSRLTVAAVEPALTEHRGTLVNRAGDGFLATFESALDAAGCAIALQQGFERLGEEPGQPPIRLRVGLNLADVIVDPPEVFGDGVNLAQRLQTIAEPGGVVVSAAVADQLRGRPGIELADLGDRRMKNLRRPVRAFGLRARGVAPTLPPPELPPLGSDRPSIAVLPLREPNPDPETAYIADGVIEGIIHILAGLPDLFVIAHGSTAAFAAADIDARTVGQTLGVRYVMDGTLRRAGARLRITTRLIDVQDGSLLRVARFEGEPRDVFDMQDRVSADIVAAIAPTVRERELARAVRKPPETLSAYDCVLRALDVMPRLDPGCFDGARELLRKAIAADPGYAVAWSYLAFWHLIRLAQGWTPSVDEDVAEAGAAAAAALTHDPGNSTALAIKAHFLSYTQRDFVGAAALLERAVAAGPSNSMAWTLSSATSGYLGLGEQAVRQAEQALRLSPMDPFAYLAEYLLGQAHYIAGDFAEAVRVGRRVAARNAMHAANLRTLAASLVAAGDRPAAAAVAKRLLAIDPRFSLAAFAQRTPISGEILETFVARLRDAGLPDQGMH